MVKVLRKVIEKMVDCPECGRELSFDDSDEKPLSKWDESKFIYCPCGYFIPTKNGDGTIAKGVTLITVGATE